MEQTVYQKILLTHDGSPLASEALPHALAFAKQLNTEILLLYVIPSVTQEVTIMSPGAMMIPVPIIGDTAVQIIEEKKKEARETLQKIKITLEGSGARWVETQLAQGTAEEEIVAIAKEQNVDLIIMSTHGRSGLGRVLLGSVADYVVRHASCPVLLVHPSQKKYLS